MISVRFGDEYEVATRTENGKLMRWRDANGVLHAVEGSQLVQNDPGTIALWTRCAGQGEGQGVFPGSLDVPADSAWEDTGEQVECRTCRAIESRGAL